MIHVKYVHICYKDIFSNIEIMSFFTGIRKKETNLLLPLICHSRVLVA